MRFDSPGIGVRGIHRFSEPFKGNPPHNAYQYTLRVGPDIQPDSRHKKASHCSPAGRRAPRRNPLRKGQPDAEDPEAER